MTLAKPWTENEDVLSAEELEQMTYKSSLGLTEQDVVLLNDMVMECAERFWGARATTLRAFIAVEAGKVRKARRDRQNLISSRVLGSELEAIAL